VAKALQEGTDIHQLANTLAEKLKDTVQLPAETAGDKNKAGKGGGKNGSGNKQDSGGGTK